MNSPALVELLQRWGARAEDAQRIGATAPIANVVRDLMRELEETTRAEADELLDLTTAAKESGYSDRALRAKLAAGEIENRGAKHRPRIRRGDLPRKTAPKAPATAYDLRADALALVRRG